MGLEFADLPKESSDTQQKESPSLLEEAYGALADGLKAHARSDNLTSSLKSTVSNLLGDLELFDSTLGGLGDLSNHIGKRSFETREDGATSYTVKNGDTLTNIAEDSLKAQHKDDANYKPSPAEVQRQVDAIARANHIENPNLIHTGDKLVIPSATGHLVRDPAGIVKEIQYPDGKTANIEYSGFDPKSIKSDSGSRWEKQADGSWSHFDKTGTADGLEADKIDVTSNGDINIKLKDSTQEVSIHADGTQTDKEGDGSVVERDDRTRITEVRYPDSSFRKIDYGSDGQPKAIVSSDGSSFKKEGDRWTQYRDGKKTGVAADDVLVTPNGDIRLLVSGSDQEIILHRNGSRSENELHVSPNQDQKKKAA